jgi:AbiTii
MNLVNELQVSAEQDDVLTVLRKTKRLASKLGRQDIGEWLRSEFEGYADKKSVPDYRQVRTTFAMKTNGYVPAGYGMVRDGIEQLDGFSHLAPTLPVIDPISDVLAWIESMSSNGNATYCAVHRGMESDRFLRGCVDPMFREQVSFLLRMNDSQIKGIPEQIKNRVLNWACMLEAAGVHGENMSFDETEKQLAHAITFNISHSKIEQLNNMGTNHKE